MLAMVGGLSVASRSLSDLKQVTYVDSGTRALAAAEAGLQYAFANACSGGSCTVGSQTITGLTLSGISSVTYQVSSVTKNSLAVPNVAQDDVVDVDMSGNHGNLKYFDVSWKGTGSVEIEVVDSDNTLRRYAYNANGQTKSNGFADGLPGSDCTTGSYCTDSSFTSCTGLGTICYKPDCGNGNITANLVRIKPLYGSTDIRLCGRASGNSQWNLDLQYYSIIATATTTNGTVRRLQADYYPSALPALFDNVIYTGGSISK